jgi:hypothetical protein
MEKVKAFFGNRLDPYSETDRQAMIEAQKKIFRRQALQ